MLRTAVTETKDTVVDKKNNCEHLLHRGCYMSAQVLFDLINELGKKIICEDLPSILSIFSNEFNKFNNTGTRMEGSIYHDTKITFIIDFRTKTSRFRHTKRRRFNGRQHITYPGNLYH